MLIVVISRKFYQDLALSFLLLTWVFVMLNKVITAQYFLWFWSFLPLIISQLTLSLQKVLLLIAFWFGTQFSWLYWAYYLEFQGLNCFFYLFLASVAFFAANVYAILEIIRNSSMNNWISIYHPRNDKID
jgi:phosphatidylinositol glycan class M